MAETTARKSFVRPRIPRVLRALDAAGRAAEWLGLSGPAIDEVSLCAAACRKTGLSDFGDERFRIGLRKQLESLEVFERHPYLARLGARIWFLNALRNRLLVEQQIKEHPEILELPVPKPLVLCGLGRCGTTLLQHLLAQDPASRPLLAWEAASPAGPRETAGTKHDGRVRRAARLAWVIMYALPRLRSITMFDVRGPVECGSLLRNAFILPGFRRELKDWSQDLSQERLEWAYGQYRRQLQLLQWQRPAPGHWLLKWPLHLYALETLVKTLPGVGVVQMHRDPVKVVSSSCQMISTLAFFLGDERWRRLPREMMCWMAEVLRRADKARGCLPANSVLDVRYDELVRDPIATVRRIYEYFGYPYSHEFGRRARKWLAEHPSPERSKSYHNLEQFGLDQAGVEETFAFYYQQHEFERET